MFTLLAIAHVSFTYLVNSLFGENTTCRLNKVLWSKCKRRPKIYLSKHGTVLPLRVFPNTLIITIIIRCSDTQA